MRRDAGGSCLKIHHVTESANNLAIKMPLIIPLEAPLVPLEVFSVHANPLPETFSGGVIWLQGVQREDYF